MVSEKYIELIQREIEGKNSSGESKRLEKYLSKNEEAQKVFRELAELAELFCKIPDVEPPEHLEKSILQSIPYKTTVKITKKPSIIALFTEFFFHKKIQFAYAFSFGIIAGIFLISMSYLILFRQPSVDMSDMYGSIAIDQRTPDFRASKLLEINENNVQGNLKLLCSSDVLLLEVMLESQNEIDISLEYEEKGLTFKGFRKHNSFENSMVVNNNSVNFSHHGENNYIFVFGRTNSNIFPIMMKIYFSGKLIYDKKIVSLEVLE